MLARGDRDHPRAAHRRAGRPTAASTSRSTRRGSGTCPTTAVEIAVAVARRARSIERFAPLADHLIAVEPEGRPGHGLERRRRSAADRATRPGRRADPDLLGPRRGRRRCERAHEQFRWFAGGWKVNADLPTPAGFAGRHPVRPPRGRRRVHPLRPRPRRDRRGGPAVLGGRASPTSRWCRSAARPRTRSSRGRRPAAGEAAGRVELRSLFLATRCPRFLCCVAAPHL